MSALRHISEEERLEIYDRLATKWALKMEAKMTRKKLLKRHPGLMVTTTRIRPGFKQDVFIKNGGTNANGAII